MDARELLSVNPREWHAGQLPGTEQAARQSRRATDEVRGKSLEPDQLLMAALRRGDQNAVREVVQRLNPRLFRVARGIVASDAEAEDVVQKTYLLAFTHLHQFREDALFSTWITRIAINTARMQMRSERSHDSYDTVADEPPSGAAVRLPDPFESPDEHAGRLEAGMLLHEAVSRLPEQLRLVFLLREVEDMDIQEIARDLKLHPITVKTRLFRARRQLRSLLEASVHGSFQTLFPFDGVRCAAMAERVVNALESDRGWPHNAAEPERAP